MDFVNKEDVVAFEVGQHRRKVTAFVEDGTGCLAQVHPQFGGDDVRHCGFAEAGRAEEQDVIQCFAARECRFDEDGHLRFQRALSDVFGEALGADGAFDGLFVVTLAGAVDKAVGFDHGFHGLPVNLSCRARRMRVSVSASSSLPTRSMSCAASPGL